MRGVGVEVDAGDVAACVAGLVALEEEVRAVVVAGVGALLAVEDEVGVLVGLGLGAPPSSDGGSRHQRSVAVVAVERDAGSVLERLEPWATGASVRPTDRTFGELTPGVLVLAAATFARLDGSLGEALPVATKAAAATAAAARTAASGRRIVRIMFPSGVRAPAHARRIQPATLRRRVCAPR